MLITETNTTALPHRIVLQTPICESFAFDTTVLVRIMQKNKWLTAQFAKSNVSFCRYVSRGSFQEQTIHPVILNQTLNGWISYLKDQFYSVPETKVIYYTIEDKDIDIWVLIPKRDFKLLRRLVELEMKLLDTFSYGDESLYRFEFHVIYLNNAKEETIVPSKAVRLSR